MGEDEGEKFWTALFTLLIADMDEELEKGVWGGVKLGGRKIYTLVYADNVAVLGEDEEGMRGMIAKLERYMDGKGLQVNVDKTKIMRCRRGGRWKK